jgi:hypothetical protein
MIKWAGHVAWMGKMRNAYKNLGRNMKKRDHLDDLGIDGKILVCNLEKQGRKVWTVLIWLQTGTSGGVF